MSANSIGPDGRGGLGLGEGDAATASSLDGAVPGVVEEEFLQAENKMVKKIRT
ncbi:MAG: hypothetical protein ACREBC_09675 [Pyrinomonadaceae bacterium]